VSAGAASQSEQIHAGKNAHGDNHTSMASGQVPYELAQDSFRLQLHLATPLLFLRIACSEMSLAICNELLRVPLRQGSETR